MRCYISETKVKWRRGGGNEGVGLGDNRPQFWGDFAYVSDYMCKFISLFIPYNKKRVPPKSQPTFPILTFTNHFRLIFVVQCYQKKIFVLQRCIFVNLVFFLF